MKRLRRVVLVLSLAGLLAVSFGHDQAPRAQGQPGRLPAADKTKPDEEFTDSITLPPNTRAQRMLEAAQDFIKEERWTDAVYVLQQLRDIKEDAFVRVERGGGGRPRWTSVRAEANRLVGAMPASGLEVYEIQYGNRARVLLQEAKQTGNVELLAEVAQRYLHTKAGSEATNLLGTYHLDRAQPIMAALCFERLLRKDSKPEPLMLLKATLAFRAIGDTDNAERAWKKLERLSPGVIQLAGKQVPLEDVRREFNRLGSMAQASNTSDWLMFQGVPSRSTLAEGDTPYLDELKWKQITIPPRPGGTNHVRGWIEEAHQLAGQQAVMPAFFPVAARNRLIYRSHGGVEAIDIRTGRLSDGWSTTSYGRHLAALAHDEKNESALKTLQQWINLYKTSLSNLLLENSTLGTLSTDGHLVFAIDDVPVPPPPQLNLSNSRARPNIPPVLLDALEFNKLQAIDIITGKLTWELGGNNERAGVLADSFFLGPPLPLGDKLYVMIEKGSYLRLVCLEAATGKVSWMQTLAAVRDPLPRDPLRRINAVNLAYGDGVLVCPTNAGAILGVDLLTHSLVWAHSYGEADENPDPYRRQRTPSLRTDWKNCAPVVRDGKTVFTAPDGKAMHCLDLRDGSLIWKSARGDDLYLGGVFRGKVIVVGKHGCRALDLTTGQQLWSAETGVPSGQGAASGRLYYLPLKSAAQTGEPEVCAVDIDTGRVVAHTRGSSFDPPGNLIFHEGKVIAQTGREVVAYPQVKVKLAELDALVRKEPDNTEMRFERGELRLFRGDLHGAVGDLHAVLDNNPDASLRGRARGKLFDALTQLLQADFDKGEIHLDRYRALCTVESTSGASQDERDEARRQQHQRHSTYLSLLARGREKQGRLVESFQAYLDFGALAGSKELITLLDEPTVKVRPDVWVQGRISQLLQNAAPPQRRELEKEIAKHWKKASGTNNTTELRRFVSLFGGDEEVAGNLARESRLQLAERLIAEEGYLEAELQLLHVQRRGKDGHAGRATDLLARLMTRRGLFEDAAYWYRILRDDFAAVVVRDGKTGADLYRELTTDKRFLPYLDAPDDVWEKGRVEAHQTDGNFQAEPRRQWLETAGPRLPFFRRFALAMNWNNSKLELIDRVDRREVWTHHVNTNGANFAGNRAQNEAPCYLLGHLAVVSVGTRILGIDTVTRELLWERDLYAEGMPRPNQILVDSQSGLRAVYLDGRSQRLGLCGPVNPSGVRLQTQDGLMSLDPFTGSVVWVRHDLPAMARVFGKDDRLYFIEQRGEGVGGKSHALRARDGVSVEIPDFADKFTGDARILGDELLVAAAGADGKPALSLYDIASGKTVWSRPLVADTKILESDSPRYLGLIEPGKENRLTVIDLQTRNVVLERQGEFGIRAVDLDKSNAIRLLDDPHRFYVAINGPPDPKLGGGPWSNLVNIHSLSVNGALYAFSRHDDKKFWRSAADIKHQMLVMDHFAASPVILCTSRYYKWDQNGRRRTTVVATKGFEKRTGKLIFDSEASATNQFSTLDVDPVTPRVEIVGRNMKIEFLLKPR